MKGFDHEGERAVVCGDWGCRRVFGNVGGVFVRSSRGAERGGRQLRRGNMSESLGWSIRMANTTFHITSEEHGGSVGVYGETGVALMTIDERGGRINVSGNRGGAWMSIGGHGGFVSVHDMEGKEGGGVLMGVEKHGGMVWAYSGGDPKATMDIDENGGRVNVAGKNSQTSQASMAVTASGDGGVFTWDKDRRRLHKLGD